MFSKSKTFMDSGATICIKLSGITIIRLSTSRIFIKNQNKPFSRYFVGHFTSGVAAGATSYFLYDLWNNLAWLKFTAGWVRPRHVIYSIVYFSCYDPARESLPDPQNSPLIVKLVIAQVVTICSILLTHPFYTVDSRMVQFARKKGITYDNKLV